MSTEQKVRDALRVLALECDRLVGRVRTAVNESDVCGGEWYEIWRWSYDEAKCRSLAERAGRVISNAESLRDLCLMLASPDFPWDVSSGHVSRVEGLSSSIAWEARELISDAEITSFAAASTRALGAFSEFLGRTVGEIAGGIAGGIGAGVARGLGPVGIGIVGLMLYVAWRERLIG